jgi:hydroxyacylglutathione hydrolase
MVAGEISGPDGEIIVVKNSIFPSNSYICATGRGNECFLVDPGTNPEVIDEALLSRGLSPALIVLTHGHFDHTGSVAHFLGKYGIKAFMNAADERTLKANNFMLMAFKIPFKMIIPEVELVDTLSMFLGGKALSYIPAPGHTPGSCLIEYGAIFFSGDTLYSRGVGEPRLPGGDSTKLKETLRKLVRIIPPESMIYPGHGESASFGRILEENKRLIEFVHEPTSPDGGI